MRTRLYICISVLLAIVSGCQQPYEMKLDFALNRDELRFTKAESQAYFLVYSQGAWTAEFETPVAWATLSRTSGHGNQQVAVVCGKNTSVSRGARIIVTNHDGKVKTVYLSQESSLSDVYYTMLESNLQLLAKGASVNLSAETNIPEEVFADVTYQVESTAGTDWISDIVATPEGFSCVVADYIGEEGREAVVGVYFPAAEWDETRCKSFLTIRQSAVKPQITLASDHELNPDGGIVTSVPLEFNWAAEFYAYDLSYITFSDDSWVSAVYDEESQSVKVTPQRNKTGQPRETVMTCYIKDQDGTVINTATTKLTQGIFDGIDPIDAVALYEGEKYANCYLIENIDSEVYWFDARKVDGTLPSEDMISAEILWQNVSCPIDKVMFENGRVYFKTVAEKSGNAVITVKDSKGVICWSWHIWVAGSPLGTNTFGSYVFMDRNLGATSFDTFESRGLNYEWGRKDPFPGAIHKDNTTSLDRLAVSPDIIANVKAQDGKTIEWTIQNPASYVSGSDNGKNKEDWYYDGVDAAVQDNTLWGDGTEKSIYDPCPYGYRVPSKAALEAMAPAVKAGSFSKNNGMTLTDDNDATCFIPASGWWQRKHNNVELCNVGTQGRLWSCTASAQNAVNDKYYGAYMLHLESSENRSVQTQVRRWGHNVRCVKINN